MKAGYKYFTYFADELPQIVKKFFPCISSERKDTFIAGNSMGAYGAFKLAMLRPERYIAAGGISGGYTPSDHILNSTLGFSMDYWEDIFGDIQDIKTGNNDILALAQKLSESKEPKPELYMWCGTEDWLLYQNHQIKDGLNRLGFNLTYSESTGMHSWECWDKVIRDFLDWIPLKKGEN
jgi:S-formylglutathione hydrolase FrmB